MSTLKSPNIVSTGKNPPAVFWREAANQFMAYIGYHLALKGKKQGTRVRTAHYLGRELRDAIINACKIDQDWDIEVAYWKSQGNCKPVWRTEHQKKLEQLTTEMLASEGRLISLEPDGDEQVEPKLTLPLKLMREKYATYLKSRLGLNGKQRLKAGSFRSHMLSLNRVCPGIGENRDMLLMPRSDYRQLIHYWLSQDRKLSERTAANYLKDFKAMPHQLEAVYDYFIKLPRVRFLLADDPGAGKTIMAGLLLKEMKIRGLVKRTLIVTPANLTFQWQREMKDKFREQFSIVRGDVLRANYGSNPWQDQNQVITSVSWVNPAVAYIVRLERDVLNCGQSNPVIAFWDQWILIDRCNGIHK